MTEDFVCRNEFNNLKEEVQNLKEEIGEYKQLLTQIDKKCDVITEKIASSEMISTLKISPLEQRVVKIEDSQVWLRRVIIGGILAIIGEAIVFYLKIA